MQLEFDIYEGKIRAKGFCDHCGNVTFQKVLHYVPVQEKGRIFTYSFSQCTICNGVILRKHFENWDAPAPLQEENTGGNNTFEQLWPPSLSLPMEAPERVRQIYEEARLVRRHSPSSVSSGKRLTV